MKDLLKLFSSDKTVFSFAELKEIYWNKNAQSLRNKLAYNVKTWKLEKVAKWIYAIKWKEINSFELANKIYSPSYISFFSALYHHSIIFQYEKNIYLAYKKSDTKKILDFEIKLKNLKKEILLNPSWIINNWNYSIAWKERAFLDTIYIYSDVYFDDISKLDYEKILELLPIYDNKSLEKKAKSYFNFN
jgi:predicted transcriptional regulator of viral defense system